MNRNHRNPYALHTTTRPTRAAMDVAARRYDARIAARQRSERIARALYCGASLSLFFAFFYGV